MKSTTLIISLLIGISLFHESCASSNENRFTSTSIIHLLFEMFRDLILKGDIQNNVPASDPFIFNVDHFTLNESPVHGVLNVTNGVVTGLGRFRLEKFDFFEKDLAVTVELTIPALKFEADHYELNGKVFDTLPVSGAGIFYAIAKDVTIYTTIYFQQSSNGKSILVDRLENTNFTIAKIVSLTEYDKHIDHIFNAIIEDVLPSRLSRFSRRIAIAYLDYLVDAYNPIMAAYDTWSILATIIYN